jgi:hypothetical protein
MNVLSFVAFAIGIALSGFFLFDAVNSFALFELKNITRHLELAQIGTAAGIWLVLGVLAHLGKRE